MAGPGSERAERRATVDSVAEHAGVSRQTVSNALNAPHKLRPETLERVRKSISDLGYRPNNAARTLRTQSTRLLACRLLPSNVNGTGGVLDSFLHALCASARDRGYDVLAFHAANDDDEIEVFHDLLQRHAVDGVVLTNTHFTDPRTHWLLANDLPFVAFGRPWGQARPRHSWVDVDGAAGVERAVERLVELGHRRVGFLGWPKGSGSGDDRCRGWERAMERFRLPTRGLLARSEDGIAAGAEMAGRLLDRARPASAIVCVSDALAVGALRAVADRGLRAGQDVSVVGFDDSPVASVVRPGLASLRQPLEAVAEKVVDALLCRLAEGRTRRVELLVPPSLVERASLGPPT